MYFLQRCSILCTGSGYWLLITTEDSCENFKSKWISEWINKEFIIFMRSIRHTRGNLRINNKFQHISLLIPLPWAGISDCWPEYPSSNPQIGIDFSLFCHVQNGSYMNGIGGYFTGGKATDDHSRWSGSEVKNTWTPTSVHRTCLNANFAFLFHSS